MKINSEEWWDEEFRTKWIYGIDGRLQTAYYASLFLTSVDNTILEIIQNADSMLDYGCALGEATNILNTINHNVTGYDFSEEAINLAKINFPHLTFKNELSFLDKYDVIYCSNVLEHFEDPYTKLEEMSEHCNHYIIILAPYNQKPNEFHFHKFIWNEFYGRNCISGFKVVRQILIQTYNKILDGGQQILYILGREAVKLHEFQSMGQVI